MKPTALDLYKLRTQKPFRPFRVILNDGKQYDLVYPDIFVVGVDFLAIGVPIPDTPDGFPKYTIRVPLSSIERVAMMQPTPSEE